MASGAFFTLPEWGGRPREAGTMWTLRKGTRVAACQLWTHPIGGEVRITIDGDLLRSEARRDAATLIRLALEWQRQFEGKGWSLTTDEKGGAP